MKARHWLVAGALVVFVIIGYFNWHQISDALRLIRTVTWPVLFLVPVVQILSFYSNAKYYQTFLANFEHKIPLAKLYKLSLALNFVNQVSPSVGLTGITYFSYALRPQVPAGKSTLVQYGRYVLTYISFAVLLILALFSLYFGGGIDKIIVRIVIILVASSVVGGIIFFAAFSSRDRFNRLVLWLQRIVDWLSARFRKGRPPLIGEKRMQRALTEFHEGYDLVMKERRRLGIPFIYALAGNIMEVLTVYVVFLAMGAPVNIGAVIIGYAVASATAVVSLIPGDVGVYEVTQVAAMSASGIPVALGLSVTLIYRVLNKALFLPIGFYYYSQLLGEHKPPAVKPSTTS